MTASGADEDGVPGLDVILGEIDQVVEPVTKAVSMAPAVGIAVAGGPVLALHDGSGPAPPHRGDSVRAGLSQAGPVAVAGLVVNGAGALVVVAVARLVSPQAYGAIAQLLGLFFILSMPGSAVLVGDHPLNDVVGAKRSGWRAVWIDRRGEDSYPPPPGTDERPDAVITSLGQLAGVLAAL